MYYYIFIDYGTDDVEYDNIHKSVFYRSEPNMSSMISECNVGAVDV